MKKKKGKTLKKKNRKEAKKPVRKTSKSGKRQGNLQALIAHFLKRLEAI